MLIKNFRRSLLILFSAAGTLLLCSAKGQTNEYSGFSAFSRLSFYSHEKSGEFIVRVPSYTGRVNLTATVIINDVEISSWSGTASKGTARVTFPLNFQPGKYNALIKVRNQTGSLLSELKTNLVILNHKPNEVKTDLLTGGLIVNKLPFFPFGFYCYSPVYPTLPEEEAVNGFNLISPYQKIMPETLAERKGYMDRCAQLGMKVNYNLLSVSGGGGVGSSIEGLSDIEKDERLKAEINIFKDHPALLAWYISDEPNGFKVPPEKLEKIYQLIKEIDPWHPVSIVFSPPFGNVRNYMNTLDIAMADPYPVPEMPVTNVGEVSALLKGYFSGKKPLWMAAQAFGGGERWEREPTPQEIRSMTWQAIINGSTGIQYFIRQGPNYFPKSTTAWNECGKIAMEVAELTPWLLSDEETIPVESGSGNIIVTSKLHNGKLVIIACNKTESPLPFFVRIPTINNSKANVIFENRIVKINFGILTDFISSFGNQIYLIDLNSEKEENNTLTRNLILDPGFENYSSPGVPSACYARPGGERGATFFLDSREYFSGDHSLRIITPVSNKSVIIRFFPVKLKQGASYILSLWAKSDPEQRFFVATKDQNWRLYKKSENLQYVEVSLGEFCKARFVPDSTWNRYITFFTIPDSSKTVFNTNLILKMPGQGVAWFDDIRLTEEK